MNSAPKTTKAEENIYDNSEENTITLKISTKLGLSFVVELISKSKIQSLILCIPH